MKRKCNTCGLEAHTDSALNLFAKDSRLKYGRKNICKVCVKDQQRHNFVMRRYGITKDEYLQCMATSDCCKICSKTTHLVYDHDHSKTGVEAFRGVLCRTCNTAIGQLGDNIQGVEQALKYLKEIEESE